MYTYPSVAFPSFDDWLIDPSTTQKAMAVKENQEKVEQAADAMTLDSDKLTILCLMMCLPEQYRSLSNSGLSPKI